MGELLDALTKPCFTWGEGKKVVNNYYVTNNYYIHTENKVIQVNEQQFRKFIEKRNLKMIEEKR